MVKEKAKKDFPQDVYEQLLGAISAVFLSWESNRAKVYRKLNHIPSDWGTAVNVQSMVFGNMGNDCATGVVFTRNPSDGINEIYGEYLINAQGEDVVAGTRTPQYITRKATRKYITKMIRAQDTSQLSGKRFLQPLDPSRCHRSYSGLCCIFEWRVGTP